MLLIVDHVRRQDDRIARVNADKQRVMLVLSGKFLEKLSLKRQCALSSS
jgi:hypothetical protein